MNLLVEETTESSEIFFCSIWTTACHKCRFADFNIAASLPPSRSSSSRRRCVRLEIRHCGALRRVSGNQLDEGKILSGRRHAGSRLPKKLRCGRRKMEMISSDARGFWCRDDAPQNAPFWGKESQGEGILEAEIVTETLSLPLSCLCLCVRTCVLLPSLISATLDSSLITSNLPELRSCFSQFMLLK